MSRDTAKGGSRVGSVMTQLDRLGFHTGRLSASGQRRGKRRAQKGIPGDVIAVRDGGPNLLVEVGGVGKRVGVALAEMRSVNLPTFVPIVARCVERRWLYYLDADESFRDLELCVSALL